MRHFFSGPRPPSSSAPAAPLSSPPMDPHERLQAASPVDSPLYTVEILDVRPGSGDLLATFRLIRWEEPEGGAGGRRVMDLREQDLTVPARNATDPRFPAFLDGWRDALTELFTALSRRPDVDLYAMPHELFDPGVLDLKRPQVAADFADALLGSKSRLGRWLPPDPGQPAARRRAP